MITLLSSPFEGIRGRHIKSLYMEGDGSIDMRTVSRSRTVSKVKTLLYFGKAHGTISSEE
jgi:hypothetical protein